jgi:DNA-binding transcriptional ArsR family regulator
MAKAEESGRAKPGARRAERPLRMKGLEQMRALSHPLRLRLLELFAEKPRTTKQAATVLGEAPTRLYHHVAALERAGLVRLRETRPNRGATEKYFEAVAHRFEADAEAAALGQKSAGRDHAAIGFLLFDQARDELMRVLAAEGGAKPAALMAIRGVMRLSPAAAKELMKELQELLLRIAKSADHERGAGGGRRRKLERYSLTIALLPAAPEGEEK